MQFAHDTFSEWLVSRGEAATAHRELAHVADWSLIRRFGIGYAPAGDDLLKAGQAAGFTASELVCCGLATHRGPRTLINSRGIRQSSTRSRVRDRLRHRITFPIYNTAGELEGFTARAITASHQPKYLDAIADHNIPPQRSSFGLQIAGAAKPRDIVVVEGVMDVLALHRIDVRNAIGARGRVITQHMLDQIASVADRVIFAVAARDLADQPLLNALRAAHARDLDVPVAALPSAPTVHEAIVRHGAQRIRAQLSKSHRVPREFLQT